MPSLPILLRIVENAQREIDVRGSTQISGSNSGSRQLLFSFLNSKTNFSKQRRLLHLLKKDSDVRNALRPHAEFQRHIVRFKNWSQARQMNIVRDQFFENGNEPGPGKILPHD